MGAGRCGRGRAPPSLDDVRRPGRRAALLEQGIPFRPDREAVLTPVVDALVAREDVDADRMAVIGIGQGGSWVPRAAAYRARSGHRLI